jgi:hypothetical protein
MAERFLPGYPVAGRWHRPPIDVVAAYVDQVPAGDLSRQRAAEFGFTVYWTVAAAQVLVVDENADSAESLAAYLRQCG